MYNSKWISFIGLLFLSLSLNQHLYAKDLQEQNVDNEAIENHKIYSQSNHSGGAEDFISARLFNPGVGYLVPNQNEKIDLYTGTMTLHYVDFSVPVGPGLNMELHRTYNSSVYNPEQYQEPYDIYNFVLPSWDFGTTYIDSVFVSDSDTDTDTNPLVGHWSKFLHHSDGTSEQLHEIIKDKSYETRSRAVLDSSSMILTDSKGFKYYFNPKGVDLRGRHLLRRVENTTGQWIEYTYYGTTISKIASSDGKVLQLAINKVAASKFNSKMHVKKTYEVPMATALYFNNQLVVSYQYSQIISDATLGRLALISVRKPNGEAEYYNYDFYSTQKYPSNWKDWMTVMSKITHSNGDITQYAYDLNNFIYFRAGAQGLKIISRAHTPSNRYTQSNYTQFNYIDTADSGGIKSKIVTVTNSSYTTQYVFSNPQNDYAWRVGLPRSIITYSDRSTNNIVRSDVYNWSPRTIVNKSYESSRALGLSGKDTATNFPELITKTTTIYNADGADRYKIEQKDFDEFSHPQTVTLSSPDGTVKNVKQTFYNDRAKNILGLLTSQEVNGKKVLQREYDDKANLIKENNLGVETSYTYTNGFVDSKTDANGNTTFYKEYEAATPKLTQNPDGTTLQKTVNLDGSVASETDAMGVTTQYEYNANQQLTKTIPEIGDSTNITYNGLLKTINIGNSETVEEYNSAGWMFTKKINANKSVKIYDGLGRLLYDSFVFNNSSLENNGMYYTFDSLNRVLTSCYPVENKNCTRYEYLKNNTIKTTAPTGEYSIVTYRTYGEPESKNPVKIVEDARTTSITRDDLDYVTSVMQGDSTRSVTKTYDYDEKHRLIKYVEPETGTTEYKYDNVGNLIEKKINNQTITYENHPRNYRLMRTLYSDDSYPESFVYDKNGNVLQSLKGEISKNYLYDRLNRLEKENLKIANKSINLDITYNYNSKGDLASLTYPDGTVIPFNPNEDGKPTLLGTHASNINYHPNGYWQSVNLASGVVASTDLDGANRINHYQFGGLDLNYDYDANNNLRNLKIADSKNAQFNHQMSFKYDLTGRIVDASGPWGATKYSYDANDNIVGINNSLDPNASIKNFVEPQNLQFQYNTKMQLEKIKDHAKWLNNILDGFGYDLQGNITSDKSNRFIYGLDNNLLTVSGKDSALYEYDADHNRVMSKQIGSGKETVTFYNKAGQLLYEYEPSTKKTTKNIYFNNHKLVKIDSDRSSKPVTVSYYYNDSVGSPVAMADSGGKILWEEIYQPYGRKVAKPQTNNRNWFAGKEVDFTGLSYFGARYYNSTTGRFTSPDPEAMDPEKPFTFNRYAYGNDNPYKYVDPDGKFATPLEVAIGIGLGAMANRDKGNTAMIIGGVFGGIAAALTSVSNSGIAATASWSMMQKFVASSVSEVAINTTVSTFSNMLIDSDPKFNNAFGGAILGTAFGKKLNPIGYSPQKFNEAMLYSNKSTAFTIINSNFMDRVSGPSSQNTGGSFMNGFHDWYTGFYNSAVNNDMKFMDYSGNKR